MGRESCSDEGGLFSLDLSQHGGQHFPAKGKDSQSDSCAGIAFAKLASFCRPDTMFEYKVSGLVQASRQAQPQLPGTNSFRSPRGPLGATKSRSTLVTRRSRSAQYDWAVVCLLLTFALCLMQLLEVVRRFKLVSTDSSGVDHAMLAKLLAAAGYTVSLQSPEHQCSCKSKTRRCLENLSHTYLTCSGAAGVVLEVSRSRPLLNPSLLGSHPLLPALHHGHTCIQAEIIIEPRLMEQFEIAHPTEAYTGLLASLPSEFVGTASKLRTIVEAVSAAMADAFKAQDLSLPPWRRTSAALSKWGLVSHCLSCYSATYQTGRPSSKPVHLHAANCSAWHCPVARD